MPTRTQLWHPISGAAAEQERGSAETSGLKACDLTFDERRDRALKYRNQTIKSPAIRNAPRGSSAPSPSCSAQRPARSSAVRHHPDCWPPPAAVDAGPAYSVRTVKVPSGRNRTGSPESVTWAPGLVAP